MKKNWRQWMPQLALCVSLGIHGMSGMMPVPESPSLPEIPETELPDPVAVVPLPIQERPALPVPPQAPVEPSQAPIEQIAPQPPPVFSETVEPNPIELNPIEPDPIQPEFVEPEFVEPNTVEPNSIEPDPTDEPVPQVFDATNTDPTDISGYAAFSETLQTLSDNIIPNTIRSVTYDLNYLGDLCFTGESRLSATLAVAIDSSPMLTTGKIITSTGYGEINQAIERWFAQLQSGQVGDTDELASAGGVTLYDWIKQEEGDWFLNNEAYEAYFFNITVTLINNPCAQNQE
ncbi:MAG: hypothetical protein AAFO06_12010 [Cyanobacteria bacterium J06597_16]